MCKNEIKNNYEFAEEMLDTLIKECRDRGIHIPEDIKEVIDELREDWFDRGQE